MEFDVGLCLGIRGREVRILYEDSVRESMVCSLSCCIYFIFSMLLPSLLLSLAICEHVWIVEDAGTCSVI